MSSESLDLMFAGLLWLNVLKITSVEDETKPNMDKWNKLRLKMGG